MNVDEVDVRVVIGSLAESLDKPVLVFWWKAVLFKIVLHKVDQFGDEKATLSMAPDLCTIT